MRVGGWPEKHRRGMWRNGIVSSAALVCSTVVLGQAVAPPTAGEVLRTVPTSLSRPDTELQVDDPLTLAQAVAPPTAGEVLKTVPPSVSRPDSGLKIDDTFTRSRAITDVEGLRIEIKGFRITGLTVLAEAELAGVLTPFVGSDKRFQDLLDAAAAVKRELAGKGYFLADVIIPEQKIAEGTVELSVLEGRLGKVRLDVDADVSISRSLLESYVVALEEGGLIRTGDVERALFQIHDLRGIVARSSFSPGDKPGTADLAIKVSRGKAFDANIDFDSHGSVYTGMHRIGAGVDSNGALGFGELISVRANNAIDGNLRFARASALFPVGPWGTKVGAAYSDLKYRLGTPLFDALKDTGSATVKSLTVIHPFIRSRNTNLLVIAQHDKRHFYDLQFASNTETMKNADVKSLSIAGDFRDRLGGGGINIFNFAYTLGELEFGNGTLAAADLSGRKTAGNYAKTNISLSRLQAVSERLALYGAFSQQLTNKNLDQSEKISLGGPNAVRAYPQGEGAGDAGYFGTAELRYRLPVEESLPGSVILTGFYDFGRSVLIKLPSAAELANNTTLMRRIGGLGFGLNWEVPNDWYLKTSIAFHDQGTRKSTADHLLRFPRVYLQFNKYF